MTRIHTRAAAIFSLWLMLSSLAFGQAGGALSGTITNSTGAEVPGATIVVKSIATALERTVISDKDGFYSVPNLSPGNYEI
jgi:Carboxypeptidase regulatory-like domain